MLANVLITLGVLIFALGFGHLVDIPVQRKVARDRAEYDKEVALIKAQRDAEKF